MPAKRTGAMMTDSDNFEAFMRAYQNMVYTTAVRLLGNETDAQDIAQEVFLKAYERYAELSQSPTVGGWLKTVATNLCLNHLSRYRARWRFFSEMTPEDDEGRDYAAELPAPDTFSAAFDDGDRRRLLEQALQKLPTAQRVPLVLYHFEEKSYEDIARQLGVSLSKVKTDIHRGRDTLRQRLKLDAEGNFVGVTGMAAARDGRAAATPNGN
jgi:RNA polymerase sigma-70 factor (ECF subfamily)